MMGTVLSTVGSLLPYHILSYGTLLGTELFQSFINTKICFHYLPMREFLALQKHIFPVYFGCQIGLAVLTAATHPPYGIISLVKDVWSVIPLGIVVGMGGLNYFIFGPRTMTASFLRRAVQEIDKTADYVDPVRAERVNRSFSRNHAMSIHFNAIALVATVWYGFRLSSNILAGF
ncbi:hypothetical protein N7478_007570 [Penicillium angulare]|uniref:uncharacterized protein n=1 Tax=Penicillium angulare TaxID=116970 RepID=UPI0025420E6B|nr:uncharacterized protein N7478_007570 [Penicillium angulare]KAJ5272445.1 hypothetical protein N7478_007570 [Penicillium angulare]